MPEDDPIDPGEGGIAGNILPLLMKFGPPIVQAIGGLMGGGAGGLLGGGGAPELPGGGNMEFRDIDPASKGVPTMGALPFNQAPGGGFGLGLGQPENRGPGDTFTAKPGPKESKIQAAIKSGSKDGEAPAEEKMSGWDKAAIAASVASGLLNQGGGPALPNVGFSPGAPVSSRFMV